MVSPAKKINNVNVDVVEWKLMEKTHAKATHNRKSTAENKQHMI